jgi:hypothetical protein
MGSYWIEKPMIPIYEPIYDLRVIVAFIKETLGIDESTPENLHTTPFSNPTHCVSGWAVDCLMTLWAGATQEIQSR